MGGRFGLIRRRSCPVPTARGIAVIAVATAAIGAVAVTSIHPFLAVTAPVEGNILVVEGWLSDEALQSAVSRFEQGRYEYLVTTGGPLVRGAHLSEYGSFAELSAAILTASGFDPARLVVIPSPPVGQGSHLLDRPGPEEVAGAVGHRCARGDRYFHLRCPRQALAYVV